MLTKTDLKQIDKIFTKRVKSENEILKKEFRSENEILRKELKAEMKKGFNRLEKKLDYTINFLDRDYLKLLHRVEVIEEHLGIQPTTP